MIDSERARSVTCWSVPYLCDRCSRKCRVLTLHRDRPNLPRGWILWFGEHHCSAACLAAAQEERRIEAQAERGEEATGAGGERCPAVGTTQRGPLRCVLRAGHGEAHRSGAFGWAFGRADGGGGEP